MSSTKQKTNDNEGWINCNNNSTNKRKRRRKRNRNKKNTNNDDNKIKTVSTKPKHAAPPNAATIYCQWFQEGICHRGKNCFFIHELDPLSDKNPIAHKKMLQSMLDTKDSSTDNNVQVQLNTFNGARPQQQSEFLLPSQNTAYQQSIAPKNKYNRYRDFEPHTQQPPNPYAQPPPLQQPPNPYIVYPPPSGPVNNNNYNNTLNVNATEFVPSFGAPPPMNHNPYAQQWNAGGYNPYLPPQNVHNMNMYGNEYVEPQSEVKFNAENDLLENPDAFNEDDYEVWEDEHGEIIVVEKDQLYGDDPYYHDQKMLKQFNQERQQQQQLNGNLNTKQRGIGAGGQTYNYGSTGKKKKFIESETSAVSPNDNKNKKVNNKSIPSPPSGYDSIGVGSFGNDSNPDYNPNSQICRFWINGRCAYEQNCKMAHRFETNKCPHCGKDVGKSPVFQQNHLKQCTAKLVLDEENRMSENIECGICRENILQKGEKFGLLTGCQHAFCLKCIREWRGVINQSKEVVRACPICRQTTWFIVPCDRYIKDKKRKDEIIQQYKKEKSEIRCKHYDEDQECPFGTSCFYKHVKKDGTVDDKRVKLRHMINADGETEIMKEMRLSEFLFGPDQ